MEEILSLSLTGLLVSKTRWTLASIKSMDKNSLVLVVLTQLILVFLQCFF